MNEGGGGDNLAVAWTTGDAIVPDALPISGEYLSPWVILEVGGNRRRRSAWKCGCAEHRTTIRLVSTQGLRLITTRRRST